MHWGLGTKVASFLRKPNLSQGAASLLVNDSGLDSHPKQFCSLTSIYFINETACGIVPCSNIKKTPCVIINQSDVLFWSPLITAVYAKEMHNQWLGSVRGGLEAWRNCPDSRESSEMWQAGQLNSCDKPYLRRNACTRFRACWVASLRNYQRFFQSSSDSQYKTRALRSALHSRQAPAQQQTQHR